MNFKKIKKITPGPGQESVWDYPRPPKIEPFAGHVRVVLGGVPILDTNRAHRVLETSHPPVFYLPMADFAPGALAKADGASMCEFKGMARYYHVLGGGKQADKAAWGYPEAKGDFALLADSVAVYAHLMDACYVNDEQVQAQVGSFYGGWITSKVTGPFKGAPGTWGW